MDSTQKWFDELYTKNYKRTWIVDDLQCIIEGNITTEEMIKILDSIYEVS